MFQELTSKHIFDQAQAYAYDYLDQVHDRNVFPTAEAIADLSVFEETLPLESGNAAEILGRLHRYGSPATLPTTGGRYFGFVTGSVVPIGLAAKTMATFWDQAPALHVLSPIGAKLESVVEAWLNELFELPKETVAGFVSGTSMANFCGLAAARYALLHRQGWDINEKGLFDAPRIRIVTGRHAHSAALKAVALLGLGKEHIEWVEVDDQGRIIPELIPKLDDKTIVMLQAGNVNSGSFDDFETICSQAQAANAWVHVDGAFGLWAVAVAQLKHLTRGMEKATSWAVDGHKTLNTPYDCGIIMCADQEALVAALHTSAAYLIESPERDGMFYTPEMSRRARIIELWAIMKYLGRKGIDEMVYSMYLRARQFAEAIGQVKGYTVLNEVVFNQVIVRCASDELTDQTLRNIQDLRECWAGGSQWLGQRVIRVSICSWATTEADIERAVASFQEGLKRAAG